MKPPSQYNATNNGGKQYCYCQPLWYGQVFTRPKVICTTSQFLTILFIFYMGLNTCCFLKVIKLIHKNLHYLIMSLQTCWGQPCHETNHDDVIYGLYNSKLNKSPALYPISQTKITYTIPAQPMQMVLCFFNGNLSPSLAAHQLCPWLRQGWKKLGDKNCPTFEVNMHVMAASFQKFCVQFYENI